jgi:hypothetical protein
MVAKQDLSSFQLRARCIAPDRIHPRMKLVISEPAVPANDVS